MTSITCTELLARSDANEGVKFDFGLAATVRMTECPYKTTVWVTAFLQSVVEGVSGPAVFSFKEG